MVKKRGKPLHSINCDCTENIIHPTGGEKDYKDPFGNKDKLGLSDGQRCLCLIDDGKHMIAKEVEFVKSKNNPKHIEQVKLYSI